MSSCVDGPLVVTRADQIRFDADGLAPRKVVVNFFLNAFRNGAVGKRRADRRVDDERLRRVNHGADAHAIDRRPIDARVRRERCGHADAVVDEELRVIGRGWNIRIAHGRIRETDRRADSERERFQQTKARADRDRNRSETIAIKLGVQAVRKKRFAFIGVEAVRGREVRERLRQVRADAETIFDQVLHAADDQVRPRLSARTFALPRNCGEIARGARATLREPLRRNHRVRKLFRLTGRAVHDVAIADAERNVDARGPAVERDREFAPTKPRVRRRGDLPRLRASRD